MCVDARARVPCVCLRVRERASRTKIGQQIVKSTRGGDWRTQGCQSELLIRQLP